MLVSYGKINSDFFSYTVVLLEPIESISLLLYKNQGTLYLFSASSYTRCVSQLCLVIFKETKLSNELSFSSISFPRF